MTVKGKPIFDGLALAKLDVDFTKVTVTITAVAAFTNDKTGATHGWCKGEGNIWSNETLEKLKELRKAMELDLAKLHLEGVSAATRTQGLQMEEGLGEHLGDPDAPSI